MPDETLLLTNSMYLECISLTPSNSSAGVLYSIITPNSTYDRRIYGISVASTDANTQGGATLTKFYLDDGTNSYQVMANTITAQFGNASTNGPVDVLGNTLARPIFNKRFDNMGMAYFNLPKNCSIKVAYPVTMTLTDSLVFTSFGEIYDGETIRFTKTPLQQSATFSSATGTNQLTLLSSSIYDRRIYGISALSTDGTGRSLEIRLRNGANTYLVYVVGVFANSGNTTAIAPIDIFSSNLTLGLFYKQYDPDGSYYFNIPSGWSITGRLTGSTSGLIVIKITGEIYE